MKNPQLLLLLENSSSSREEKVGGGDKGGDKMWRIFARRFVANFAR